MLLGNLIATLQELQEEFGSSIYITLMQEGADIQLESELKDAAVCMGPDGPDRIVLIGNEED